MIYLKTILTLSLVWAFTASGLVLPFVLLYWGLGCGISISILGTVVWAALVLCVALFTKVDSDPEEDA